MPDVSSIATLERTVSFFASSSLIILAALAAALGAADDSFEVLSQLTFSRSISLVEWELFIVCLMVIYVYAFFKISWALRQYGFVVALIGALPDSSIDIETGEKRRLAFPIAKTLSSAAYHFNGGLRSYYFSLAALTWFISPWVMAFAVTLVVYELHRREFRSRVLRNLVNAIEDIDEDSFTD